MKYATAKNMENLYSIAVEHGFSSAQMANLAGWHVTTLFYHLNVSRKSKLIVFCGTTQKGTYGLAAAKHFANHRWDITVVLLSKDLPKDSLLILELLKKMEVPTLVYPDDEDRIEERLKESHIVIDALLWLNGKDTRQEGMDDLVGIISRKDKRIFSLDIPSGIDATLGSPFPPFLQASETLAFALPTKAFLVKEGLEASGEVFIADVGIPKFVYDQHALGSRPKFDVYKDRLPQLSQYLQE
jgi:ADP-dependent NAD(P)H-hydrate dehydratase / NAD(P)H-hydrate epimerase